MDQAPPLIAVMGPTGSGKSDVAEMVAAKLGAVLVSADAFQVYRGFDIGTNKPNDRSRYELIDICEPPEQFGVGEFLQRCGPILAKAWEGRIPVVVAGGTGLYIRALFEGYADLAGPPDSAVRAELMQRERESGLGALAEELTRLDPDTKVDLANPVRVRRALERIYCPTEPVKVDLPPFNQSKFSLEVEPAGHRALLASRLDAMIDRGWIEEVKMLQGKGIAQNAPAMRAIGYHSWIRYLSKATTLDEAKEEILTLTVQYAKRQRTWLRKEPRLRTLAVEPGSVRSLKAVAASIWTSAAKRDG
ncbi:MAG: tRNA (adenosine(37)-N6)-dimethylallyltransferase MiaA [Armatimonadetes bacterium]|nr:tRNA (adenosine(37)-N6)-dimethylallyltransferase MiaA [Armatimonadota bacterium]MBX3109311.1 tRNA (adenosine(37)-N6)-dimethylallyltransferase MiaA [Fimbriimonadaceae bacterium]